MIPYFLFYSTETIVTRENSKNFNCLHNFTLKEIYIPLPHNV